MLNAPLLSAQTTDELFKQVFGHQNTEIRTLVIDATLGDFFIGEIKATLRGDEILSISGGELADILKNKIRSEKSDKYQWDEEEIAPALLPFKVIYHPADMRLAIEIPSEDLRPRTAKVYDDLIPYYSRQAEDSAPFSLGLNYKLEQNFTYRSQEKNSFSGQFDTFMNVGHVSFENQMNYLSKRERALHRQSTKAVYDRPNSMQRFEVGDVHFPIVGYQQSKQLGGASFYRDFSLNPYRVVNPTSSFEYRLESRSLVKTYVNNIMLKAEYMSPGTYSVEDIPLNNGLNNIKIEATDEFGVTKTFIFNESGSVDLLAEGVRRYSLSIGYPSYTENYLLKYNDEKAFFSAFYQLGATSHWTPSLYTQGTSDYQLLGTNQIFSTKYGNWSFDFGGSKNEQHSGAVTQLTYQLNMFGAFWYDSHTLTSKVEYRSPYFNEAGDTYRNKFDVSTTVNYSVPIKEMFNLSLGGTYQNPSVADNARMLYSASLTTKIVESSSLTFYLGRNRDEYKTWSNQLYFFFNMSFGKSSTFASAFYEKESDSKRLTVIHDTGKKYDDTKVVASIDDNKQVRNGAVDLQHNTIFADLGARQEIQENSSNGKTQYKTNLRLLGSLAYVKGKGGHGFSIGRPINNSFVIFKPIEEWKDQDIGVQTSSGVNEARSGFFGETLVSGLTPYQYKRLILDPSNLAPGHVLGQESFVVFPRKNSGHLFVVGKAGALTLKGRILDNEKAPIALVVGFWTSANGKNTPFFTDREGNFFIEGVDAQEGILQIDDDKFMNVKFDLSNRKQGIENIGDVILERKEN